MPGLEGALDLQRSVGALENILSHRQEEVLRQANSNAALRQKLGQSRAQRVELSTHLTANRLSAAQLDHTAALKERSSDVQSEMRLASEVAGLKSRLSSLNTKQDELRAACRKEIERLAYFKRLIKSTSCASTVSGSEQLLKEIKQQLTRKEREMELLDMPKQIAALQMSLSQKQAALGTAKQRLEAQQAQNQASQEQLQAKQQNLQDLHAQQGALHACRQYLQKLSWECEDTVQRLAGQKSARAAAHAQHESLKSQISEAKVKIMQLVG